MSHEFPAFHKMKQRGDTAVSCARVAIAGGLDFTAQIRMLREVFGLSLTDAKEVRVMCDGWRSLDEYQESLLPALEAVFEQIAREES